MVPQCMHVCVKVAQLGLTLCDPIAYTQSMAFSRQEYWSGHLSLLQGIFPTQGSNPGFPHCRQILYRLSHKGSPRILEWVAYPFSSGSSRPKNRGLPHCRQILYQLSYQGSPTVCIENSTNCQVLIIGFSQSQPSLFCTLPATYFRTHYLMSEGIQISSTWTPFPLPPSIP